MASIINATTTAGVSVQGDNSGSLQLATNNGTTAVTIDTSQNVGIGTSSPSDKLTVSGAVGANNFLMVPAAGTYGKAGDTSIEMATSADATPRMLFRVGGATERMRIDSSGNVLIGTTSANYSTAGRGLIELNGSTTSLFAFKKGGTASAYIQSATNFEIQNVSNSAMTFATNDTERMRINAGGDVFMGTTTSFPGDGNTATGFMYQASAGKIFSSCSGGNTAFNFNLNGTGTIGHFCSSGTRVGNIGVTGSATSYNSGSDYRLKNNIQPLTNALQKVALLKPSKWIWKADETYGDGFVAHELAEVCPHAVTGEKDAVDEEGSPIHQGIDTSFLVATLTAAIQELKAELDATKAEVQALKGTL